MNPDTEPTETPPSGVTRRRFLRMAAGVAGAVTLGGAGWYGLDAGSTRVGRRLSRELSALRYRMEQQGGSARINDVEFTVDNLPAVRELGEAALRVDRDAREAIGSSELVDVDSVEAFTSAVREQGQQDAVRAEFVVVDGWYLPRTFAGVAAAFT